MPLPLLVVVTLLPLLVIDALPLLVINTLPLLVINALLLLVINAPPPHLLPSPLPHLLLLLLVLQWSLPPCKKSGVGKVCLVMSHCDHDTMNQAKKNHENKQKNNAKLNRKDYAHLTML